ncbi:MAG: 50S ribosomal protein L15 [bacterium]|jgi:large subunit ribosomal protein L15|nr:50S ribosomal protein L15 [bacterium]
MNIGELNAPKRKNRKRVGRGPGSGRGTTAGRGENGQKSRSGWKAHPWFEGGQMPLQRRIPKRGFTPRNRVEFQIVNLAVLEKFDDGQVVDPLFLKAKGLIKYIERPIKILGTGELSKKLVVTADKFSQSAQEKIAQAGGEVILRSTQQTA